MGARELLVLGASGFLGPHIVRAARGAGWRVSAAARAPVALPVVPGAEPDARVRFDATEPDALARVLDERAPDSLLCAAALSRVDACERDPALAHALNVALPGAAAELAHARGIRLVHLSTDLVFGARPPRGARFEEADEPGPLHAYGRSKAEGEARVRAAAPEALVVRLPLLYGDSLGRGLGASDQLLAALARGERPALFVDEWRTPLEATNAAEALVELVASTACGLLHVAGPERCSRHDLGLEFLRAHGAIGAERVRAARRAELGLELQRAEDVSLDARRARALLATELLAPRAALARSTRP
jgi:dTDP-4-dehydrorhamnose reductase